MPKMMGLVIKKATLLMSGFFNGFNEKNLFKVVFSWLNSENQ